MQLSAYKLSKEKTDFGFYFNLGSAVFKLRFLRSKEAEKVLAKIRRELYGAYAGVDAKEYAPEVYGHWLAEYGVAGWDGEIFGLSNEIIPYSLGQARMIFPQEEYQNSINDVLLAACANFENYLEDQAQEDAEDLKKS